ncbi:MAG: lysophospholipid acyltransferase family protein [Candidatus Limnocylindrales bacterium]
MTPTRPRADPSPLRGWDVSARLFAFGARLLVRALTLGRVRVEGLELLRADARMRGPVIVVANHVSNVDPPLVGGWLAAGLERRLAFLAKEQLFQGRIGRFMRSQGMIPVRAGRSDVDALRQARRVLELGGIIVVFPEGTRSPDGVIGEAFPGAAMLAGYPDAWIVPVGVIDTDLLMPRGSRLPRFGTQVTLRVGEPFQLTLDASLKRRESLAAGSEDLMAHVAALLPERQQGRFRGRPVGGST